MISTTGAAHALSYFEAVVLGVVQGITEFLPVSSTAHLRVIPELAGMNDPGAAASAVIQLGTTAALILYFWRDLLSLARNVIQGGEAGARDLRFIIGMAIGTVPIVVAGLLLKKHIEGELRSLWVIAGALAFFAILLFLADRTASRARRTFESIGIRDSLFVGLAQAFALVPGASRSGTTMTGALFLGIERATAARFSFLLSIPAVSAAGVYELFKERESLRAAGPGPLLAATAVSGIVGYLSLDFLLRFLKNRSVLPFVVYRLALAALLALLLASGRIESLSRNL